MHSQNYAMKLQWNEMFISGFFFSHFARTSTDISIEKRDGTIEKKNHMRSNELK